MVEGVVNISIVQSTIHNTGRALEKWSSNVFGHVGKEIKWLQLKITRAYERGQNIQEIKKMEEDLSSLLEDEEMIWK